MTAALAHIIDYALLHPTLTDHELRAGCEKAIRLGVASVCIKPYAVTIAAELLRETNVVVGTVVGFPHGSQTSAVKAAEALGACQDGARELDMVVNVGRVLTEDWSFVASDIRAVLDVARQHGALLKIIFENDFLHHDELKIELCRICGDLRVDFVKTSTGFGFVKQPDGAFKTLGATEHDVMLMRKYSPSHVQIKAAGGIRDHHDAIRMQELGCTRIGTSSPESLITMKPGPVGAY